jgi:hypothetical protein
MEKHWLFRPRTIRLLWVVFALVLAATVVAERFVPHEAHFWYEGLFGFGAWYGFLACAGLILVAKALGLVLKRPDDYYDDGDRGA